jgi:hypothetical protein
MSDLVPASNDSESSSTNGSELPRTGDSAEQNGVSVHDRYNDVSLVPIVWFYFVVGAPVLILGIAGGWGKVFESGDASAFVCGLIIACIGENIITQYENRYSIMRRSISHLRKIWTSEGQDRAQLDTIFYLMFYAAALVLLGLNMWFTVSDKTGSHPPFLLVLVIFLVSIFLLPYIRFAFTGEVSWLISLTIQNILRPILWCLQLIDRAQHLITKIVGKVDRTKFSGPRT